MMDRPAEFIAAEGIADELLASLPGTSGVGDSSAAAEFSRSDASRSARLAGFHRRLKERHAELRREFERLSAARAQLESERSQFERERAAIVEYMAGLARAGLGPLTPASEARSELPESISEGDGDRLNRLFRQPARRADGSDWEPEAVAAIPEQAAEANRPADHSAIADSVSDYMEQLLGRMRSRQPGGPAVAEPLDCDDWRTAKSSAGRRESQAGTPSQDGGAAEGPLAATDLSRAASRARPNISEIRAGVGSLRQIANFSARAALAKHTTRKLRQSVAVTLPLSITSFVLAGVLYLLGGERGQFYSQSFGTVMLGVIVTIELAYSLWKMKQSSAIALGEPARDDARERLAEPMIKAHRARATPTTAPSGEPAPIAADPAQGGSTPQAADPLCLPG
ncbi:MAG TPA: hypothetical protein VKU82_13970 [Planctomycetaceae bacterium]|nr:hypothetical protein [Planctomycetaceae bacterium]